MRERVAPQTVMTVKEVQADLRMSRNAVYEAIARNEIPSIKIGRKILIPRERYNQMLSGELPASKS
jgi:excisionase family DNA binding protein